MSHTFVLALLLVCCKVTSAVVHHLECGECTCTSSTSEAGYDVALVHTDAYCEGAGLESIPSQIPARIEELNFAHNKINPNNLKELSTFPRLRKLSLAYNELDTIQPGSFVGLDLLQQLDLSGNRIKYMDENTFASLGNLKSLQGLEMENAPNRVLHKLSNLQDLEITLHQHVTPANLFQDLILQKVRLNLVNAKMFPNNLFQSGSKTLSNIAVDAPNLTNIAENTFDHLQLLKELNIRVRDMNGLPENLLGGVSNDDANKPVNLIKVQIDGVLALPSYLLQSQKSITSIILRHLRSLPRSLFNSLSTLRTLEMSESFIPRMPIDYFNRLSGLTFLNISHNQLSVLDKNIFKDLESIITLDLSSNRLRDLPPKIFSSLKMIENLVLRNNSLTVIPSELFMNKYSLLRLDISDNLISEIAHDAFQDQNNLQSLILSKNNLTYISGDVFKNLKQLEFLDISHNLLSELSHDFLADSALMRRLDVSYNWIVNIRSYFIYHLRYLDYLNIEGNTLDCDCDLIIFVRNLVKRWVELKGDVCSSPSYFIGLECREIPLIYVCTLQQREKILDGLSISPAHAAFNPTKGTATPTVKLEDITKTWYAVSTTSIEPLVINRTVTVMIHPSTRLLAPSCMGCDTPRLDTETEYGYLDDIPQTPVIITATTTITMATRQPEGGMGIGVQESDDIDWLVIILAVGGVLIVLTLGVVVGLKVRRYIRSRTYDVEGNTLGRVEVDETSPGFVNIEEKFEDTS